MNILSVSVLKTLANPLTGVCWEGLDRPITRQEITAALENPNPPGDDATTREEHARRIAWFVLNGHTDAISVDVGCPEFPDHTDVWVIQDGNHRFAAAIYRRDETIEADFGGSLDFAEDIGLLIS